MIGRVSGKLLTLEVGSDEIYKPSPSPSYGWSLELPLRRLCPERRIVSPSQASPVDGDE
jgi:hypothetical protein